MKKVYFDTRKCLVCHSCEFACEVEHSDSKPPVEAIREEKTLIARRHVRLAEGMTRAHCRAGGRAVARGGRASAGICEPALHGAKEFDGEQLQGHI